MHRAKTLVSVDILKKLLSVWMKMLNTLQYFCQLNVNGVNENNILYFQQQKLIFSSKQNQKSQKTPGFMSH